LIAPTLARLQCAIEPDPFLVARLWIVVRLAETGPDEPVRFEFGSPSFAGVPMKRDNRPPKTKRRQLVQLANMKFFLSVALKSHSGVG
jgi:hypothetical protein